MVKITIADHGHEIWSNENIFLSPCRIFTHIDFNLNHETIYVKITAIILIAMTAMGYNSSKKSGENKTQEVNMISTDIGVEVNASKFLQSLTLRTTIQSMETPYRSL